MDAQQVLSLLIVGTAAFLLARRQLRSRRLRFKRDGPCGCSSPSADSHAPTITFRAHRDGRRSITVRQPGNPAHRHSDST